MLKRITCTFVILLLALTISCKKDDNKIRLGILPVIDALPLIVADTEGFFKESGLDVELIVFNSALEKDAALTGGSIDGYFGDMITSLLMIKNGIPVRFVCESSHTGPGRRIFGLLGAPGSGIKSFSGIGSEKIAVSSGSIIEYFLDGILEAKGQKKGSVNKVEIKSIPLRFQMLMSGSIKLALLPEPLVSKAVKDGAALLADDKILDTTATVIIFRDDFIQRRSDAVKSFVKAYNKSVKNINSSPGRYRDLMVSRIRFPEDIKDSYPMPSYNEARPPAEKDVMKVYNWMKNKRMIDVPVDYKKMIWRRLD